MLELRRFRYLVVLAKRLSYSRAAEDLGLTQSALSRAIQSLERELGVRLFDRDRAGVMLTEQGRWIVEKAEALLTSAQDFENQVNFTVRGVEGRTRFGMTALPAMALLPALAPRLSQAPQFVHEALVGDVEAMWLKLALGEIEFMVCSQWKSVWGVPDGMPLRQESLGRFPISLVVRRDHPLLSGNGIKQEFPLLVSHPDSVSGELTVALRQRFGGGVQVIGELAALRAIVAATDAIWLTSAFAVSDELAGGALALLPMPTDIEAPEFEVFLYSLARRTKSPTVLEITDAFRKRIRTLEQACAKD